MNIKKCSLKVMCAALAGIMFVSNLLPVFATETIISETLVNESVVGEESSWTTEENSFENIKVTYQQSSNYIVTIPKIIALGTKKQAAYSVKVSGDIDVNQRVYVAPVDGIADSEDLDFYMNDLSGKKADVVATVTQNKTYWNSEEVANAYEETQNCVSAPDLTAGTWEGTFQVEIRLETIEEQEHVHNYVDGKCECGAIDPNHTHNYVDGKCECGAIDPNHTHNYENGTCTICGETEPDPYETAPASAYSNWNYTLDDTNNIITLNYYTGSETDVIVYANYPVENKTYKTRLASNASNANSKTPYMFNGEAQTNCQGIKTIKFSKDINTGNVTNMSYMFHRCYVQSLDISSFNTSNVTDMNNMFSGCSALTSLDLSSFDTSNVTEMGGMFMTCLGLTELNLSNFDTSSVTGMGGMFGQCSKLKSLDLTSFDTSNVTYMGMMFWGCSSLTSIDVSSFDTSAVTNMLSMFQGCKQLGTLNLRSFNTKKVESMVEMFYQCQNLRKIYVGSNWQMSSLATNMFTDCGTSAVTR